jgi:DNA-binding LacI/PurR family transcriptional regulator
VKTRPPTIRDVAQAAGVSATAVSRFVNGRQRYTAEVEQRIAQAIAAVGYRSNPVARSMATGRTHAVAAIVAGVEFAHTASLIQGLNRAALRAGYDLLIIDSAHADGANTTLERDLEHAVGLQVDALLLAAPTPPGTAERLVRYGRPFIDLLRSRTFEAAFADAGGLLGHYLARSGHRRVALLACAAEPGSAHIERGLREALAHHAVALEVCTMDGADADAAAARAATLLMRPPHQMPDAVVACTDAAAMGLMAEAQRLGVRVPADVSVAGVGHTPLSGFLTPSLTTVELHTRQLGERVLEALLQGVLAGGDVAPGNAPEAPTLPPPRLLVRESTAARG